MKLPKHTQKPTGRHKHYYYQRHWPKALKEQAQVAGYGSLYREKLAPINATEAELVIAAAGHAKAYDKTVALLGTIKPVDTGVMHMSFPTKGKPTKRMLKQIVKPTEPLLSEAFNAYQQVNPEKGKALADRKRYWNKLLEYIGDRYCKTEAEPAILKGIDEWQKDRIADGGTSATVERERNSAVAVLRWINTEHRLGWKITLKSLPKHTPKTKQPLTPQQQVKLLECCEADGDATAAALVAMLQGGMMITEIARLDLELLEQTLGLDEPFLVVNTDDTKTAARRRVVPIVVGKTLLREHLGAAVRRAAKAVEGSASATINKRLKARAEAIGATVTGHALRHTFRTNCVAAGVDGMTTAAIGGWTGGAINPIMLGYGAEGLAGSEVVKGLTIASIRIHKHLMPTETLETTGNVVPLRKV